jgi:GNAT superfamily N-acetyltransferase
MSRPTPDAGNVPVRMTRPDLRDIPAAPVPNGIHVRSLRDDEGAVWMDVIRRSETFGAIRDGLYEREFGFDQAGARQRVYVATGTDGTAVATVGAWYGAGDFAEWGRIHWLYIVPAWQGRGLGRALLSCALHRLTDLGHHRAYLTTSTGRPAALRLYLNYGFVPDPTDGADEDAWRQLAARFTHPALSHLLSERR